MAGMVSIAFFTFSLFVVHLSEEKIRQNVKGNMSIVLEQFDVYLGNYITNIYNGFKEFESDPNVVRLQFAAQGGENLSQTAASYVYLNRYLYQFLNANAASTYAVYVNFNDGKVLTQAYEKDLLKISYSFSSWRERFAEHKYYWVDADYCRDLIPDERVGAVLFHLYDDVNSGRNGIILIALKKDFFERILDVSALDPNACLSLVTEFGTMNFGNEEAGKVTENSRAHLVEKLGTKKGICNEIQDGYFFMYENMEITDWKLVYSVKESSISNAHYILRDVMFITLIEILAAALLLSLLSRAMSHSLRVLTRKVEAKDILDHEISVRSYSEITSLSNGLEHMRRRILSLLEQVRMEQEEKGRIEVALLQEQINPHFLYNTLYSCMQLCEMKQPEQASKMLDALSAFYRIGLNGGESLTTVEEELRHVENYLFIQHFRYADLFDYTIDCASEILGCRIPKMSLQPLVENAIYHGIKRKHGFGSICILGGTYDGAEAFLEVHDDGPGMTRERAEEINRELAGSAYETDKAGVGLKNVDSRIKFEFGRKYGLELCLSPDDTCIRIQFAMKEMRAGHKTEEG